MQNSIQTQFIYFQVDTEKLFKELLETYPNKLSQDKILEKIHLMTHVKGHASNVSGESIIDFPIDLYSNQFLSYCIVPKILNSEYQIRFTNIFFEAGVNQIVRNVSEVREIIEMTQPLSFVFQGVPEMPKDETYSFSLQVEIKHNDLITRFQIDPKLKAKQSQ